jgi:hypothetical protein
MVADTRVTLHLFAEGLFTRLTASYGRMDSGVEGRFSFQIPLKLWVGQLSTAIGKPFPAYSGVMPRLMGVPPPFKVRAWRFRGGTVLEGHAHVVGLPGG